MWCISDYNHPSDADEALPRGRTVAHANVCMIRNDTINEDTNKNKPVVSAADAPAVASS